MYNPFRARHHRSKRSGDRLSCRPSGIHKRFAHSDLWKSGTKLQGSPRRRAGFGQRAIACFKRMHPAAEVHERCLWCQKKRTGCETLEELVCGTHALCPSCRAILEQASPARNRVRIHNRPVWILYIRTQEIERILLKILRFGDLEAASGFLETRPDTLSLLKRYPAWMIDAFDRPGQIFQAFFGPGLSRIQKRRLQQFQNRSGNRSENRRGGYIVLSLTGMKRSALEECLKDPMCRGIWILAQSEEDCPPVFLSRKRNPKRNGKSHGKPEAENHPGDV